MIDEKKLIDELNEWSNLDKEMNELVLLCIDTFKRMINKQPKVGEWIPCSDKLPEKAGLYAVLYHPCHGDTVNSKTTLVGVNTFLGKTSWAKRKYQKVIAWQFLSEVPKGDEK